MANLNTQFERLAYRKSYHQAFNDVLDVMLSSMILRDDEGLIKNPLPDLQPDERTAMAEIISEIGNQSDGYEDALGDIFMEYISHGHNGQFFTPTPICEMMAKMNISDAHDGARVADPACGSGRMLLAAAKINRNMEFSGSDVDLTCCKMAAVNLALNSLTGEIAWMDTLSMDHYGSFFTRVEPISKMPFIIVTGKGKTNFIERLQNTVKHQESVTVEIPHMEPGLQLALF